MITQLITHLAPLAGEAGSAPITIISGNYIVAAVFLIFNFSVVTTILLSYCCSYEFKGSDFNFSRGPMPIFIITAGELWWLRNSCSSILAKNCRCGCWWSVLTPKCLGPARTTWVSPMTWLTAPNWCLDILVCPNRCYMAQFRQLNHSPAVFEILGQKYGMGFFWPLCQ